MRRRLVALAVALAGAAACGGGVMETGATGERLPTLAEVSDAQWSALAQRRLFFGHQSVGDNIMQGMAEVLAAHPGMRLTIVESADPGEAPGLYHAKVGRNGYPMEKVDELVRVTDRSFGGPGGVAMVKFCYADVQPNTDAAALFDRYRQRMEDLRARHPGLTIVHFTMPLKESESWRGVLTKRLTGTPLERDRNAVRSRYNELLLARYAGKEPVFDIARMESTRPDGLRLFLMRGADTAYTLVHEYTSDGGHLNESARRMVAEQFLIFLARLSPTSVPAAAPRTS
jgi:hypothetical protein